jgi:hypothetical protein
VRGLKEGGHEMYFVFDFHSQILYFSPQPGS